MSAAPNTYNVSLLGFEIDMEGILLLCCMALDSDSYLCKQN